MKQLSIITGIITCALLMAACQPKQDENENEPQELPTNGMIMTGELSGSEFTIATGDEYQTFMQMVEDFNRMDAEALWAHSADTVSFQTADGNVGPLTKADMAGMFSAMDSVSWEMQSVIPVQVAGTNLVKIIADSKEYFYRKDGTVDSQKLLEEFTFDNGTMMKVRQWTAQLPEDESM